MTSLLSIDSFQKLLENPKLVILDATIDKVNQKIDNSTVKLIPNSLFLDIEKDFSDPTTELPYTMIDAETFSLKVQELGINNDSIIVLYDRWGVYSSPRAWWMFKYMNHQEVYVLNGGLPAWEAEGLPLSNKHINPIKKGDFIAKEQKNWFADKSFVLSQINTVHSKIIDARGTGRFLGTAPEPRAGIRSGHIPNSANLPFDRVLDGIYLRSKTELQEIFNDYGTIENNYIFSCGSGITASILALAAQEAKRTYIIVYDGSWTEWGADNDLPVEN